MYRCGNVEIGFSSNGGINLLQDRNISLASDKNQLGLLSFTIHDVMGAKNEGPTAGIIFMKKNSFSILLIFF